MRSATTPLMTGIAGLLALSASALATEHLAPPDPTLGHELAERVCSGCHLVDQQQRGPVVDGVPTFMSIADRLDDEAIETILLSPEHPVMPTAPLTADQRRDVVAHIRSLASD